MSKAEFSVWLADCSGAYAMTMPGLLVPIKLNIVHWWLEHAIEDTTHNPTVKFIRDGDDYAVVIGLPMGQGEEVTP